MKRKRNDQDYYIDYDVRRLITIKRCRCHPLYEIIFKNCSVKKLREVVRALSVSKWYSLKKTALTAVVVSSVCANRIVRFCRKKRTANSKTEDEGWCPISLTPISEIKDPFIHDDVCFEKQYLIDYFSNSYNFVNPGTMKEFNITEIKELGNKEIEKLFKDRLFLRERTVSDIYTFSFLEDELENTLHVLIELRTRRYNKDPELCRDARLKFHRIWIRLLEIDKNRTVCVMRGLKCRSETFYSYVPRRLSVCMSILDKYLMESI